MKPPGRFHAPFLLALACFSCASAAGRAPRVVDVSNTSQLSDALSDARPGDSIVLAPRTYGTGATSFTWTEPGTADKPITVRGATSADGSHPVIAGRFSFGPGVDNYDISGLEFDGSGEPAYPKGVELVLLQGRNIHFHGNYLHSNGGNCLSTFGSGVQSNQVIEDNVFRDCHYTTYAQNDFDSWGYKKFVHNVYLDARDRTPPDGNNFLFHGYTQSGINSGFYLRENVFSKGRVLFGGTNNKTRHEVAIGNVFYAAGPQIAYRPSNPSPAQVDDFSQNKLWKSPLGIDGLCSGCAAPNRIVGNKFWEPAGAKYSVINALKWCDPVTGAGTKPAGAGDVIDLNQYWSPTPTGAIHVTYWFPGGKQSSDGQIPLTKWRTDLQDPVGANCRACEAGATVYTELPLEYSLFKSDVEAGRGVLALIAAGATEPTAMAVDLSPVVPAGSGYSLIPARLGPWGAPTLSGVYAGGKVTVPIPLEFEVYVIVPSGAPGVPAPLPLPAPGAAKQ